MPNVVNVDFTPNPHAKKFQMSERLLQRERRQFNAPEQAKDDPLAAALFEIEGVVGAYYADRFVTIEKAKNLDWTEIEKQAKETLDAFDYSTLPEEGAAPTLSPDSDIYARVTALLKERVMPALAADGGGLEPLGMEGKTLTVRYQGACGSCPSATRGTLQAIEMLLKHEVDPEIEVHPG
jgi:Fe-S cluster biogenesis protein NfuA